MLAVEFSRYDLFKAFSERSPKTWTLEGTNLVYDELEELNGDGAMISPHDEEMFHNEFHSIEEYNKDFGTDFAISEDAKLADNVIGVTSEGHIVTREI